MLALNLLGNNGVPPIGAAAASSAAALAIAARETRYRWPIAVVLERQLDFSNVVAAITAVEPVATDRIESDAAPVGKRPRLMEGGINSAASTEPTSPPDMCVVAPPGGSVGCFDAVSGLSRGHLHPDCHTSAATERLPTGPVMFAARANWRFVATSADAVCGPLFDAAATPPAAMSAEGAAVFTAAHSALASWLSGASSSDGSKPWGREGCAYTVPTEPGGPLAQLFVVTSPAIATGSDSASASAGSAVPATDAGLVDAYSALLREAKACLALVGRVMPTAVGGGGSAAAAVSAGAMSSAAAGASAGHSLAAHGRSDTLAKPTVNAFALLGKKPPQAASTSSASTSHAAGGAGAGRAAAGGDGGPTGLSALRQIVAAPERYPDSLLFADRYPDHAAAAAAPAAGAADSPADTGAWIALRDKYPKSLVHALLLVRPPPASGSSKGSSTSAAAVVSAPVSDSLLGVPSVLKLQPRHLPALRAMREAARRTWVAATSELAAALSSRVPGWAAGAAAAGLLPDQFESHARVGFHALPSLQPLHLHVMSRDGHSEAVKNKVHFLSFTHAHFFLPLDGVIAALEQQEAREGGGGLGGASIFESSASAAGGAGAAAASAVSIAAVDLGPAAAARAEAALKGQLACHVCGRSQTNMPSLKAHLLSCLPGGDWLRKVPPAKAR